MSFCAKIVIILLITLLATSSSCGKRHDSCKKAKVFRKNRMYLYSYVGTVENGVKGASENAAKMRISAKVTIEFIHSCEYFMQLENVKVEESFGMNDNYKLSPTSKATAKSLQLFPLRFVIDNGIIRDIKPVLRERQKDILNIKRGILSSFQVKWSKRKKVIETDISGVCSVDYDVVKHKNGMKTVQKTKDLATCKKRTLAHSNIETIQYKQVSSIYDAKSSCGYSMKKKNEIARIICNEYYLMKPFSTSYGAGSYTNISQMVLLQRVQRIRHRKNARQEVFSTSLLFEHKHEENPKSSDVSKAVELLHKLVLHSKLSPLIASDFAELVYAFRSINEQGIGKLLSQLKTCFDSKQCSEPQSHSYRSFFFDALSQCGSDSCVNIVANLITSKKIPLEQIDNIVVALNFIQDPSPSMINAVMGIYTATKTPTALLLLGTLMHKLCEHRPYGCREKGTIRDVITDAEFFLMRLLGNDCRNQQKDRNEIIYYALKAIGNAGRPVQMTNVIIDCLRYAVDTKISIAALNALRRMPLNNDITDTLRITLIDRNIDPEKRMESFLLLMKNPTEADIILSIDMVNDEKEAHQMRSFVHSFLSASIKNKDPSKRRLTDLFKKTLKNRGKVDFNPSPSRFSKVFGNSFFTEFLDIGSGYSGYTIFHPESFLPRTMKFSLHSQILGHSVDILDVNARMEGLEMHVNKLLGDKGYFSKEFVKKVFDIPNDIGNGEKSRERRNVKEDSIWPYINQLHSLVNMKESIPDMDLSIKVFGNEIKLLKLKDIPVLNGYLDKFNILKSLYTLTKGKSASLQRNALFLEGNYIVPTIAGLPLAFEMNGSAAFSLHLDGKIKAKNLILGPKMVKLQGSAVPIVSLDVSGKVTVYGISSKAGIRYHSKTHASNKISGEVEYEEGNELKLKIDAPENDIDLFNYTHEIFHVAGANERSISGSKKKTKLNFCSEEFSDVPKYIGMDICSGFSFPVSYHDLNAPFYPLTGPASIGFRLRKTDPSLKHYFLKIVQKNGFFELIFDSPGTSRSRKTNVKLGFSPWAQKGVIGATFGNSNQGILFNYEYDNSTNGLQTNFKWNLNKKEVLISANFYNETDPATLDMKMGLKFNVIGAFLNGKCELNFIDTYGFWGIDLLVDFGNKPFRSELKVAYNPQTVFTRFAYGDKNLAVQLVPAYPVISYDMQVNWKPALVNLTIKADLIQRKIDVVTNTSRSSYAGDIKWEKANGIQKLIITAKNDKDVFRWLTHVDYNSKNRLISSKIIIKGNEYGIDCYFNKSTIQVNGVGFSASLRANVFQTLLSNGVQIFGKVGQKYGELIFYFQKKDKSGVRKICGAARAMQMSYNVCLSGVIKDDNKRMVKIEFASNSMRFSTKFVHSLQKSNYGSSQVSKDIYSVENAVNDATRLFAKIEIDRNQDKERVSSFLIQLPKQKMNLDVKVPKHGILSRKTNANGWIKLKYRFNKEVYFALFKIEHSRKTLGISLLKVDAKLIRKRLNCTDIISYTEMNERNDIRRDMNASREIITLFCGNIHSFEDRYGMGSDGSHVKWQTNYKFLPASSILNGPDLINVVKKNLKFMKPITSFYGDIYLDPTAKNVVFYPNRIEFKYFDKHVIYQMDMMNRLARIAINLSKFNSTVAVNFSQSNSYDILVDYSNNSLIVNQAKITVKRSDEMGLFEITIHHPFLKGLIQNLKSIYRADYEKYKAKIHNISEELISKLKLSNVAKRKLSSLLMLARGERFLLKNASKAFENLADEWRTLVKEIVKEEFESALKQPGIFKNADGNVEKMIRYHMKSLIPAVGVLVDNLFAFDKLKFMNEENKKWKIAKESLVAIAESSEFKNLLIKGARKLFIGLKMSQQTQEKMIEIVRGAINKLELNKEMPTLLLNYIRHQFNASIIRDEILLHSLLNETLMSANLTNTKLFHTFPNTEHFFQFIFKEMERKTNLNMKLKEILQKSYGKLNISEIMFQLSALNKWILRIDSNATNLRNPVEKAKVFLRLKLESASQLLPYHWRKRIGPIIKNFLDAINAIQEEEVAKNATKLLFNIGEDLVNSVFDYITTNFSSDLEKDLKAAFHDILPKISIGNLTLPQYWTRTLSMFRERLLFGLRLSAQVFPQKVESFKKKYVRDNEILHEKMFKDFINNNLTSSKNIIIIQEILSSMGNKVLEELSQATSNFSTGGTLLKLLKFAKDIDVKDLNSIIKSYGKVKKMKSPEWSFSVFLDHLKDVIKSIGKTSIGNKTVNYHIVPMIQDFNKVIPKMIKDSKNVEKIIKVTFKNSKNYLKQISQNLRKNITKYSTGFGDDFAKWQKFVQFASDLSLPALGTARKMLNTTMLKEKSVPNKSNLQKLVEFLMKHDRSNLALYLINVIENTDDQPPKEVIKTILRKFADIVQDIEKSGIKKLKNIEKIIVNNQKEIRTVLKQVRKFLAKKSSQPLHKIIQKSGKHVVNYLKSVYANSSVLADLQAEIGSIYDLKSLRMLMDSGFRNATKKMEEAFDRLDIKDLRTVIHSKLPNILNDLMIQFSKMIVSVLNRIDLSKQVFINREYLNNPKKYLLNAPSYVMVKLRQILMKVKPDVFKWVSDAERSIKKNIMKKGMVGRMQMKNIVQSYLKYFDEDLRKLDYLAVMYKMMKKVSEEKLLTNYTSKFMDEINVLQKMLADVFKGELSFESAIKNRLNTMYEEKNMDTKIAKNISIFIQKVTALTRKGLADMKKFMSKKDWETQRVKSEVYRIMNDIVEGMKMLRNDFAKFVRISDDSTIVFMLPKIDTVKMKLVEYFSWNKSQDDKDAKKAAIQFLGDGPMKRLSIKSKMYNQRMPTNVETAKVVVQNATFISTNSHQEFIPKGLMIKSLMEHAFMFAQKSFNSANRLFSNGTALYQHIFEQVHKDLNTIAKSIYMKNVMTPLKRISEFATIPVPAEKLQSIIQSRNAWKKATKIFTPLSATAIFFNGHVFTFDGNYAYLPSQKTGCNYILSRDFRGGMFTIIFKSGELHMHIGRISIVLSKNGKIKLSSTKHGQNNELPAIIQGTMIETAGKMIAITSPFGLQITCNKELFLCNFIVPGFFHNKTLGIFGSNNAEFADDFKLPNGLITIDLLSFINSWKINGNGRCHSLSRNDLTPGCSNSPNPKCFQLFKDNRSPFSQAFNLVNPLPYFLACQRDTSKCDTNQKSIVANVCTVASLYIKQAFKSGIKLEEPLECAACRLGNKFSTNTLRFNSGQTDVDIVLVVRDSVHSKKALRNLRNVIQKVDEFLKTLKTDIRYTLVGFGGISYRLKPYIQTGNGKASGSIRNLMAAMGNLQYKNNAKVQNGLEALKFASELEFRPFASKIFMVLDTVAVYTGSLRKMVETNNLLVKKAIILNVINKYKFKKNVIGHDAFNIRYHLKIPRGERLRNLLSHTSDDYVPIVKESGGAILTVKGLVSSNEKWIKAFPITLKQIIFNQINNDKKACKSCSCAKDNFGFANLQCTNSDRNVC